MPKAKRPKKISLTRTTKKGLQQKQELVADIRNYVDTYARIFVFSVQNMRNSNLKEVRKKWRHSRLLLSKNKVIAVALGRTKETEYQDNLRFISERLQGECGLLFTNCTKSETLDWFKNYTEPEFARSGVIATETVVLDAGPLPQFSHTLEPYLRKLNLPTSLNKGVIMLNTDYTVCKEGEMLSAAQARLLKLLEIRMVHFEITIHCMWSKDGTFENFTDSVSPIKSPNKAVEDTLVEKADSESDVEGQ